jgi:hypothetical protein
MEPEKQASFVESPLDAWRGSGRIAKEMFKNFAIPASPSYLYDLQAKGMKVGEVEKCPCGSKECDDDYKEQMVKLQRVIALFKAENAAGE